MPSRRRKIRVAHAGSRQASRSQPSSSQARPSRPVPETRRAAPRARRRERPHGARVGDDLDEEDPAADAEAARRVGGPTDDAEEAPAEEAPASEAPPAEQPDPAAEAAPAPSADDPASEPDSDANAWQPAVSAPTSSDDTHASAASKDGTLLARTKPSKWAIRQNAFRRSAPPVLAPRPLMSGELNDRDPEVDEPGVAATVWLHRKLPDPTPPCTSAEAVVRGSARTHLRTREGRLGTRARRASGQW